MPASTVQHVIRHCSIRTDMLNKLLHFRHGVLTFRKEIKTKLITMWNLISWKARFVCLCVF